MDKFTDIVKAWGSMINSTPEEEELAAKRYDICRKCPERVNKIGVELCGACGCPLKAKVYSSKKKSCPLGKWRDIK